MSSNMSENIECDEKKNREELKEIISSDIKDMFWQTLIFLEIAFPHEKGDGTENEKRFNVIRSKILRIGNDHIREIDNYLKNYVILKMYNYEKQINPVIENEIFDFRERFRVNPVVKK